MYVQCYYSHQRFTTLFLHIPMTKVIVFSAPSGSGKSTLVQHLIEQGLNLHFSISATSRPPRGQEQHGVEYFFLSPEEFRAHIEANDFLEYEEVYKDRYYGTLTSQVESQLAASVEALQKRLEHRGTETPEAIQMRLDKAEYEMSFASQFDTIIINDNLETAKEEIYKVVNDFIKV